MAERDRVQGKNAASGGASQTASSASGGAADAVSMGVLDDSSFV